MGPCHGYSCLARSLEEQDARDGVTEPRAGGKVPPIVPVLAAAAPVPGVFAGTPLEIVRAALEPWRRSAT